MYVGPWQEYAIARTRKKNEIRSKLSSKFKEDLESAMINSLDPVSAARAMKAMEKVMDRSEVPFAIDGEIVGGKQNKRRAPKVMAGQHNLTAYKLQLPSVSPGSVRSQVDADRNGDQSTPNSVRTSASEPLGPRKRSDHMISPRVKARQNRMMGSGDDFDDNASTNSAISHISIRSRSGMNDSSVLASENGGGGQSYQTLAEHLRRIPNVPATLPKVESGLGAVSPEATRRYELEKKWGSQPPYNASAAVTALRLAKAGQAKPMLTYSGYWEWSKESESKSKPRLIDMGDMTDAMTDRIGSSDEVEGGVGRAGRVQSKREEDIISKVERVKRMQQIYSGKHPSGNDAGGGPVDRGTGERVTYVSMGGSGDRAPGGLDEGVTSTTAPPTPLLTQYQQVNPSKPGVLDSPLATSIKKSYEKKPITPIVTEMDLTDQQLAMISKYFPDQLEEVRASGDGSADPGASMALKQPLYKDAAAHVYDDAPYGDDEEISRAIASGQSVYPPGQGDDACAITAAHPAAITEKVSGGGAETPSPSMTMMMMTVDPSGAESGGDKGLASASGESATPRQSPVQMSPVGIGVQIRQREASSGRQRVLSSSTVASVTGGAADVEAGGAMDDLYAGGGSDSLLDWSAGLDVNAL